MSDHIVKAFDEELQKLKTMLAQMGGLAEEELAKAIDAISRRDGALADAVIASDAQVDQLERAIEERAILVIAKRQPMASDLREIMVAIRVSSDLERIGDFAKNIAKRTHAISEDYPRRIMTGISRMGTLAVPPSMASRCAGSSRHAAAARTSAARSSTPCRQRLA
ncbi:MAG: phosphate transport system regulatory protein PhoU [Betaproteobacteria bacterium]|nr:phosphate transport system regulatory protein PhoU [Betaproteobacteria bacterium]